MRPNGYSLGLGGAVPPDRAGRPRPAAAGGGRGLRAGEGARPATSCRLHEAESGDTHLRLILLIALVAIFSAACSKRPAPAKPPSAVPAALIEVSGGKQVAVIGSQLDQPLIVQVNDAKGSPVSGASVWFGAADGVKFDPSAGVSGADGQFTTVVALGGMAGHYKIAAYTKGAGGAPVALRVDELALGFQQNHGKQLSDLYCARCHDSESTPERVSNHDNLVAPPHAFSDGNTLNGMSQADLQAIIQHGGPALGKSAEMPPYGATLAKADVDALAAYIRAVADPPYHPLEVVYAER